ncbi:unnamed protein product [Closterium sp. Naga37s-1]|nr:unnamed protein product [Closterium sp. Naga37s-1]
MGNCCSSGFSNDDAHAAPVKVTNAGDISAQPNATTEARQFPAATIPQYTPSPVSPYRPFHSAPIRGATPHHFSAVVPVSPSPPPAQVPGSTFTPPPASSFPPSPSANPNYGSAASPFASPNNSSAASPSANPNNSSAASPSASPSVRANAFYDSAYHASASATNSSAEPLPPAITSAGSSANQSAGSSAGSSANQSAGSSAGSSASQSANSSAGSSASQSANISAGSSASQSANSSAGSSRGRNSSASPSALPVLREFSFADLHMATGGFARAIGEGGFGKVYQGRMVLPAGGSSDTGGRSTAGGSYATSGRSRAAMGAACGEMRECDVAVKVMNGKSATRDLTSFKAEVEAMSAVNHPNILRLEGVALNTSQGPMLVYELIPGGDVRNLLKQVQKNDIYFSWENRMKVALGCAEALATIHEHKFVHRDFKSSNVLLREDFTPVVADFGLARTIEDWKTHVSTKVVGSMGYIDPIYLQTGQLCQKSDTFAFGVFLLELISSCSPLSAAVSPLAPPGEFTFAELHAATGGFADSLAEGGHARVYRGRMLLPAGGSGATGGGSSAAAAGYVAGGDGETRECDVAVRVTTGEPFTTQQLIGFMAEVAAMSAVNHPNILRFEGMGIDTEQMPVLVHELIPGGDVSDLLRRVRRNGARFPWKDRVKVALGCAEALAVIHDKGFIYCNFKSSKVFLREDLTPVVAGTGLTRYVEDWERRNESAEALVGAIGSIDPNYFLTGEISQKFDIYAFGAFLLELIFGYNPTLALYQKLKIVVGPKDFDNPSLVTDPTMEGEWEVEHVLRIIALARSALNFYPTERPPISGIAVSLRALWSEM